MDFLRDQNNKKELFALLTSKVIKFVCPPSKVVYVTSGERVISAGPDMTNCNHEEADTRVVVHILNALEQGMKSVKVRTVDTDVVIILAGAFYELCQTQPLADIWIAFGMSKNYRFYSIIAICASLGEQRSRALPVFHTLTECDTTSASRVRAKSQPGRPGRHMKRLQRHWSTWLVTCLKSWMYILITFRKLRDGLSSCLTESVPEYCQ